ncbi:MULTISPECIES: HEPN domain-containing protein [Haloferax]|uniref:HEPN domain-containing protein n=1 Tax=Haloferax volcanii TaxID=2246 RepID=A0A558G9V5_HALVO|nr:MULTISPECIES: HEPN domain-containing protein [Haloferax]MDS0241801.1 HEPN domain-containing protein [Haloferax sp. S2CR25]MDS0444922.1 HEPN domain-containing protein [Haloferax sp. S2CR25-2]TVT94537.1 HEPN domain-containing protein [Haloferax volcanii]
MSEEIEWTDEMTANFLDQMFDLYFNDALEEEGLDRTEFRKGQVFLKSPFAASQFDELDANDSDVEVRVNDDAQIKMVGLLKSGESVEKGERVTADQIAGFEEVILEEDEQDYGHITVAKMEGFGWVFNFDLRRNRSYYGPLIEAADQFIQSAEYAKENELWRAFVENAFHAAERMMKIDVIFLGWKAEKHGDVQSRYHDIVQMGHGNPALYDTFNQLKDKYRFSASYVDPKGCVDEKEFDFGKEDAKEFISVIKNHRESLSHDNKERK